MINFGYVPKVVYSSNYSCIYLRRNGVPIDQSVNELVNSKYNHQERYGMMAMDYDCLDQLIYKESTCTGAMYNKLNLKAFESGTNNVGDLLCKFLIKHAKIIYSSISDPQVSQHLKHWYSELPNP